MRKKMLVMLMSGVLSASVLAGCGGNTTEPTTQVTTSASETEVAEAESANSAEETESDDSAEVVEEEVEATEETEVTEETESDDSAEAVTEEPEEVEVFELAVSEKYPAPEGYEDYVYGYAPLSSIYSYLCYDAERFGYTLEDTQLNDLYPEYFASTLDAKLGLSTEEDRYAYFGPRVAWYCSNDEEYAGFFEGTWLMEDATAQGDESWQSEWHFADWSVERLDGGYQPVVEE